MMIGMDIGSMSKLAIFQNNLEDTKLKRNTDVYLCSILQGCAVLHVKVPHAARTPSFGMLPMPIVAT